MCLVDPINIEICFARKVKILDLANKALHGGIGIRKEEFVVRSLMAAVVEILITLNIAKNALTLR
jgi:hypothetical protein